MDLDEGLIAHDFIEARNKLINKTYLVRVTPLVLDTARLEEEMFDLPAKTEETKMGGMGTVMHRVESSPNEDFYLEMLTSSVRLTGDKEMDERELTTVTNMYITAVDMANIIKSDGTFAFVDPSDFANLYNDLEGFARRLEDARMSTINRDKRSVINMTALITLAELVRPKALLMKKYGEGIFAGDAMDIRTRMRTKTGQGRMERLLRGSDKATSDRKVRFSGERR